MSIVTNTFFKAFLIGWTLFTLGSLFYFDLKHSRGAANTDYCSAFYVAGSLVSLGRSSDLYPHAATQFGDTAFNAHAHKILPSMIFGRTNAPQYLYLPVVARIFEIFSFLPANISLLVWQSVSILSLSLSVFLLTIAFNITGWRRVLWLCMPMTFFPAYHVLWQGQVSIVFGILPLCAAFLAFRRNRPMLAGIILGLTLLKAQFFILALFIVVSEFHFGRRQALWGLFIATSSLLCINVASFGFGEFACYLEGLKLSDSLWSNPDFGKTGFKLGLPRHLLFMVPESARTVCKPIVYAVCLGLMVATFHAIHRFRSTSGARLDSGTSAAYLLGGLMLPIVAPHFFIYDLVALLPGLYILLAKDLSRKLSEQILPFAIFLWIAIDVYWLVSVFARDYANGLFLCLLIVEVTRRMSVLLYRHHEPRSVSLETTRDGLPAVSLGTA